MHFEGTPVLSHGAVDTSRLRSALPPFSDSFWFQTEETRKGMAGERPGLSLILQTHKPHFQNQGFAQLKHELTANKKIRVFRNPDLQDIWRIVSEDILPVIQKKYPGTTPVLVQLATLPGGAEIPPHCDTQFLKDMHRLHVPIITNENVEMVFEDVQYSTHLEADQLYEINNMTTHAVYNRSDEERLHLLIDLLPEKTGTVHVHNSEQDFLANSVSREILLGITMLRRNAPQGHQHGHFVAVNPTTGEAKFELPLKTPVSGANPRGGGRGFRGVTQNPETGEIYLSENTCIRVLNSDFSDSGERISHPAMSHIHALYCSRETLWAVSTANDTLFGFSAQTGAFTGAWEFSPSADGPVAKFTMTPERATDGPGQSHFHLNAVTQYEDGLYLGGMRTNGVFHLTLDGKLSYAPGPAGTHDMVVVGDKLVVLDTVARKIRVTDLQGNLLHEKLLPPGFYADSRGRATNNNIARRGFLRGISHVGGDYIFIGYSPAGVLKFDIASLRLSRLLQMSPDPHWMVSGLAKLVI